MNISPRIFSLGLLLIANIIVAKAQNIPKRIVENSSNRIELSYNAPTLILVDKNEQWEIDKNASTGFGQIYRIEDEQGNNITNSTGTSRYRIVPLVSGKIDGKLILKRTAPAYQMGISEELQIVRDKPYLQVFSPLAQDPNKELSATNFIEIFEQTNPNNFFLQVPLTFKSNVIWNASMSFSNSFIPPWAFFSLTSRQDVKNIYNREISTNISIENLNYSLIDDAVNINLKSTIGTNVLDPGVVAEFKIVRNPLIAKITAVDQNSDFVYRPANSLREVDTIFVPYYRSKTNFTVTTNASWEVFNDVELTRNYNLKISPTQDSRFGSIEILQDNSLRDNMVIVPVLLLHKKRIKGSVVPPWKVAVIVQKPGYIDVEKQEIREKNPAPGQISLPVKSNLAYSVSLAKYRNEDNSWITLDQVDYTGDQEIKLSISSPNYTGKDRRVQILLKAKNGHGPNREIIFIHSSAYLKIIKPKQVVFPNIVNSSITVQVQANVPWTPILSPEFSSWLKISEVSSEGFVLQAENNTSGQLRFASLILESKDNFASKYQISTDAQFVKQLLGPISLQVSPYPRMIFLASAGQKQALSIKTSGGWQIEKLPDMDYSWLGFPDLLFGNGSSELIFSTIKAYAAKEIRKVMIRVSSQLKDLPHYDVEILQIPEQFITVNTLVKDELRVTFSAFEPGYKARVFSEFGVMAQEIIFNSAQQWVDVSILPTGNYLLYFYDKDGTVLEVKKIVKM